MYTTVKPDINNPPILTAHLDASILMRLPILSPTPQVQAMSGIKMGF